MTLLLIILVIYLVGCVLAFGRDYAEFDEIGVGTIFMTAVSWIGFLIGVLWWEEGRLLRFRKRTEAQRLANIIHSQLKATDWSIPDFNTNYVPKMYMWRE